MTDINSPEQHEQQDLTPQEKLQKLWNMPESWGDGMAVRIDGVPEGIRAIETQNESLILRSVMPNLPDEINGKQLRDVPFAVFNSRSATPDEIIKSIREFTNNIVNHEITFVPPVFKEQAA